MEDFVPFFLAKKLKEKGFNAECYGHYFNGEFYTDMPPRYYQRDKYVSAPFISQVLKWFRKEKQIEVNSAWDNKESKWFGYANEMDKPDLVGYYTLRNNYESYEQAALAVIEYVIDNLI